MVATKRLPRDNLRRKVSFRGDTWIEIGPLVRQARGSLKPQRSSSIPTARLSPIPRFDMLPSNWGGNMENQQLEPALVVATATYFFLLRSVARSCSSASRPHSRAMSTRVSRGGPDGTSLASIKQPRESCLYSSALSAIEGERGRRQFGSLSFSYAA